jgi:Methyltransferase FkbM domain
VRAITLDAFNFPRLDLIKMDVEGMEMEALAGAAKSIQAHHPLMLIEALKVDAGKLRAWLEALDYTVVQSGINLLAIHQADECLKHLKIEEQKSA